MSARRTASVLLGLWLALLLGGCGAQDAAATPTEPPQAAAASRAPAEPAPDPTPAMEIAEAEAQEEESEEEENAMLCLKIADTRVSVDWEDNASVAALSELCREAPLSLSLSGYGGFEQVGPIGTSLPRADEQTVTEAGDIVLYAGSQIVVFYGSNSWAYTRLGHITDQSAADLARLLGRGDVTITLWQEG